MLRPLIISSTVAFLAAPVIAGPCTERIADLERAVTAQQEGAGPALSSPTTTGSTGASPAQNQPATSATQTGGANRAMQMLAQAKQLDQQGQEAECMQLTTQVRAMIPEPSK